MDALLLALLLTALLDQGSGTQRLVSEMGERGGGSDGGRVGAPVPALFLVIAVNAVLAAALGAIMATWLMPDARLLFFAIALAFGAFGHLSASFRRPSPPPPQRARKRALFGYAMRRAGENSAFVTAAIVTFTDAPLLAVIGATVGGWIALILAQDIQSYVDASFPIGMKCLRCSLRRYRLRGFVSSFPEISEVLCTGPRLELR
ncbi:MAG: hypothetical protein ABW048_02475 [Sphingobium sp.]